MAEDTRQKLTAELLELEAEARAIRRMLGGKSFDGHLNSYKRFWQLQNRIKKIKHILMLCGHIP